MAWIPLDLLDNCQIEAVKTALDVEVCNYWVAVAQVALRKQDFFPQKCSQEFEARLQGQISAKREVMNYCT